MEPEHYRAAFVAETATPVPLKKLRKLLGLMHPKTQRRNHSRTLGILLEICLNPGRPVTAICARVQLSQAAVNGHLVYLAKTGAILPGKRGAKHGKRVSKTLFPVPTEKGLKVIQQLAAVFES